MAVRNFVFVSKHEKVVNMKRSYEEGPALADNISWNRFWNRMLQSRQEVDAAFVQGTAWLLQIDIYITSNTSNERNPFTITSGNINDENIRTSGAPLLIGNKTNVHYQSLLPAESQPVQSQRRTLQQSQNSEKSVPKRIQPPVLKPVATLSSFQAVGLKETSQESKKRLLEKSPMSSANKVFKSAKLNCLYKVQ